LGYQEREVFAVLFLDSQHRLIEYQELFFGTIDAAAVYPREVVKAALDHNAAAVIFSHNHPSGVSQPSQADIAITEKLKKALNLIDVRTLDHIIIGEDIFSFAESGYL
jgi:DNA repair protein RadC